MKTTATAWNLALVGLVAAVCMALAAPLVRADGYVRIEADSDGRYNVGVGYSSDNNDYYDDGAWYEDELAPYGRWRYIESLQTEMWFPYVDETWRPYTDGHWINTKHGWTWVAYEPWGDTPHHFGRWVYLKRAGWGWVPGDEWGPAWVTWGVADGHIGWAPIPPANWVYHDRFDYAYSGNVSYGYGGDFGYHRSGLDFNLWVFVSNGRFYDSHVRLNLVSAGSCAGWFQTRRVLPIGPRLHSHYVSRYCAAPIRTVVLDRHNHSYGNHKIAYYKPHGQTQKIKERGRYGVYTKRQPVYRAQSKRSADNSRSAKIVPKSNVTNRSNKANAQSTRYKSSDTRSTPSKSQVTRSQQRSAPDKSQVTRSQQRSAPDKSQVTRSQQRSAPDKAQVTRSQKRSAPDKSQVTRSQKRSAPSKTTVAERSSSRDISDKRSAPSRSRDTKKRR